MQNDIQGHNIAGGLDRVLVLEVARVTEAAAIAAARLRGRGDEKAADGAAVDAMRKELAKIHVKGRVVMNHLSISESYKDSILSKSVGQVKSSNSCTTDAIGFLSSFTNMLI